MLDLNLVTYGRLSEEFYEWAHGRFAGISVKLAKSKDELREMLPKSNVYAGFNALYELDQSHLKWIHAFGAGIESFLRNDTLDIRKTFLSRTTGKLGKKIGEYCLAHVLNPYQKVDEYKSCAKTGAWEPLSTLNLYKSDLLILGTGSIGSGVAQTFSGLVKSITGVNTSGAHKEHFNRVIRIGEPLSHYDIIINTLPETSQTYHLLDQSFFEKFNKAIFINVGRGSIVEPGEIIQSIKNGYVACAVLDVFEQEPLSADSPLWGVPEITITPHISGVSTIDDVIQSFNKAFEQIKNKDLGPLFVNLDKGY